MDHHAAVAQGSANVTSSNDHEFDAIVVGTGPAGATLARELTRKKKRVLILERGSDAPYRGGFLATASILNTVPIGDTMATARAITTGGTSAVYFGVANDPPLEIFQALGIDLAPHLAEAKKELPLGVLPDQLLGAQAIRVRDSAAELGLPLTKNQMLIDQTKCPTGYAVAAKWNARTFVDEAVAGGATFISRAEVLKVLIVGNKAIGVEYKVRKGRKNFEVRQAFGRRVILSAGGTATPLLLRESGMQSIARKGFYIHPCFAMFGLVPGLKAEPNFVGSAETRIDGNINIGDGNFDRAFHRMFMLGEGQFLRAFRHARSVGIGVMVKESLGGELRDDGSYHKQLKDEDLRKLEKGADVARQILEKAGARNLFRSALTASHLGGSIRIREDLDENLETECRNLHVCDGSVVPETVMGAPSLTLICLGKYLAGRLASRL
jgi:choline dehydrogenase-like flavoprotein